MPLMAVMTWAFIWPALADATPRSRYLKNSRRPATSGEFCAVAWASLCPDFTSDLSSDVVPSIMSLLRVTLGGLRLFVILSSQRPLHNSSPQAGAAVECGTRPSRRALLLDG